MDPKPVTRKRVKTENPAASTTDGGTTTTSAAAPRPAAAADTRLPFKYHLMVIVFALLLTAFLTKPVWEASVVKWSSEMWNSVGGGKVFTLEELSKYDGSDELLPIYLGVKGRVYDVTAGRRHYGKGGSYNFFAGRDASRSFVTGCFNPNDQKCTENSHDLTGLTEEQMGEVNTWLEFYEKHKEYFFVGTLKQ